MTYAIDSMTKKGQMSLCLLIKANDNHYYWVVFV